MFEVFNKLAVSTGKAATLVHKTYKLYDLKSYSAPLGIPLAFVITFANNKDFSKEVDQILAHSFELGKETLTSAKHIYKYLLDTYDTYYPSIIIKNNNDKENLYVADVNYSITYNITIDTINNENIMGYCYNLQDEC